MKKSKNVRPITDPDPPHDSATERFAFPEEFFGVDFSGAQLAGRKIWITRATRQGENIIVRDCFRAAGLPGADSRRDNCLPVLLRFIERQHNAAFGLDFPFSLPISMIPNGNWEEFVCTFAEQFQSPKAFREYCRSCSDKPELKRLGDIESQAPFSPYNLWIYRQTYYGIRDILSPLVQRQNACILPQQTAHHRRPWILESCPASILKKHDLYIPYKGPGEREFFNRKKIMEYCIEELFLRFDNDKTEPAVLNDRQGDGLDSILTAIIIARLLKQPKDLLETVTSPYHIEGKVYY